MKVHYIKVGETVEGKIKEVGNLTFDLEDNGVVTRYHLDMKFAVQLGLALQDGYQGRIRVTRQQVNSTVERI